MKVHLIEFLGIAASTNIARLKPAKSEPHGIKYNDMHTIGGDDDASAEESGGVRSK
jgi:hypothetical protein